MRIDETLSIQIIKVLQVYVEFFPVPIWLLHFFRFDPLSRAFSNRCVCDENAQRISVDGRPKRIEMYAFSKEKRIGIEAASI